MDMMRLNAANSVSFMLLAIPHSRNSNETSMNGRRFMIILINDDFTGSIT